MKFINKCSNFDSKPEDDKVELFKIISEVASKTSLLLFNACFVLCIPGVLSCALLYQLVFESTVLFMD